MKRCSWCSDDELYKKYHDEEWGVPVYDDRVLFEFLTLEGAQAGLSWITILRKREAYRKAFDGFDWEKVAEYGESDVDRLMAPLDTKDQTGQGSIVRNRLKILSTVNNAKRFAEIVSEFGSFSDYIWGFTDGTPKGVPPAQMASAGADRVGKVVYCDGDLGCSELSDLISGDLKRRGFSFVGTRIVYAFLQAVGVVCGHEAECFCEKNTGI